MKEFKTINELRKALRSARQQEKSIGFVPTMGALHAGHESLIARSVENNDLTVLSIFINPIQFNEDEDFAAYPRDLGRDLDLAEAAGVDFVFTPEPDEMYIENRSTMILVQDLTDALCGISRGRGHFAGVCTVVLKLFNIVQPTIAYFGLKDAQQALVIQRMVRDLDVPVQLEICPIVREEDGLAMSSRNARITDELRPQALALRHALLLGRKAIEDGEVESRTLINLMATEIVAHAEIELDYLDIVSPETLQDKETVDDLVLIAGAFSVGEVRLIDNLLVGPDGPWED